MSPRHLEAAATRTFQVLVEGDYSGALEAGIHYQPVHRDLSDIEAALDLAVATRGAPRPWSIAPTPTSWPRAATAGARWCARISDQVLA